MISRLFYFIQCRNKRMLKENYLDYTWLLAVYSVIVVLRTKIRKKQHVSNRGINYSGIKLK